MLPSRFSVSIVSALLILSAPITNWAQSYPSKPIRLLVPAPPAGPTDLTARVLAEPMAEFLQQPVIVENRAGANGILAMEAIAKAPADGYTLILTVFPILVVNPLLYSKITYSSRDFTPIGLVLRQSTVLLTHAQVPVSTLAEFISFARAKDDSVFYGTYGAGSMPHLAMGMLMKQAKLKMVHVPYSGNATMNQALLAGQVQVLFSTPDPVVSSVKVGKLRALATARPQRSPLLPNTPTFDEAGMPNFDVSTWTSIVGPAGMPADVVTKVNAAMNAAINNAKVRARLTGGGMELAGGTPAEFAQFLNHENERWGQVIKDLNLKLD
ncbi:MAG: Bug family tripartite tricarboxylate transporter substrate binding protein [Burkholderiales bacterium]